MPKMMWCLDCEMMVQVQNGSLGQVHLTDYTDDGEGAPELNWCEGPFVEQEPTVDSMTVVFDLCNGHDPIE